MTRLQKLQIEQSEVRSKIGAALDSPEAERAETWQADLDSLTKRAQSLELELRAAISAGDEEVKEEREETSETRELREMVNGADLGNIFDAVIEGRQTDGSERELQSHYGLNTNQIPIVLLESRAAEGNLETRDAATVTGDVTLSQAPIIGYVYPRAVASFLGVRQPTVPVGERSYPVLTTPATVGTPAKGAGQDETTAAFTVKTLTPRRVQAGFSYAREDAAVFAGMSEALRANLSQALADKMDNEVINGAGGFLGTGGLSNPTNPTTEASFATYRGLVYGRVDGRYASVASDVRLAVGAKTYEHAAEKYRSNTADDSALDTLIRVSGGVRVANHIPIPVSNDQTVIAALGTDMNAVAPIWDGVTIIDDQVTKAAEGEIKLTAVMLMSMAVLRADGFARLEVQLA